MVDITSEQAAWVFKCIVENAKEGGTFRHLIYDKLGFGTDEYEELYMAGGMAITNNLTALDESSQWIGND